MRNLAIAAALTLAAASSAQADIHYQGLLAIISSIGNCDPFIATGLVANADYHPAFVDDAPPQQFKISAMNIYYNILGEFGAHTIRIDNRKFPFSPEGNFETPNPFKETNIDWFDYAPAYPANLVVTSERRASPPAGFPTLAMVGKIAKPVGSAAENTCVVTFEFTGIQSQQ